MFTSWTLLGSFQIMTNRYLVHKYTWRQTAHTVSGIAIAILTLCGGTIGLGFTGWVVQMNVPHAICANPTVIVGVIVAIGGVIGKWKRDKT